MDEQQIRILFGKKIKALRNNLNVTQFTLGEMADVNQRQITLIESGKSFPSLKTLVKFSKIFNCKLKDLFSFENLQDDKILKSELSEIIEKSNSQKIKTLYTIAKELI